MSVILGINALHAGSSAAIVVDGKPVAAIAEERLNRVKYYANFPALAIQKCLDMAGVEFSDIDAVAVGRDSSANLTKKLQYALSHPTKLLNLARIRTRRTRLDSLKTQIANECGVDEQKLRCQQYNVEHHLAHTASAYFASPWDHAAGFTLDGSGDFVTCMLSKCEGNNIVVTDRVYVPHSLGSLYTMICEFIGYSRYGDEGKVMGLAPLGTDTYHDHFDDMIILRKNSIELNPKYFMAFGENQGMSINDRGEIALSRHYSDHLLSLFGNPREPHSEISKRDEDLAFGLQRLFEKGYMHLLNILHSQVPQERVVMAGGCVLNSVANGKVFDQTPFQETWIQPAAGDDGLSLGAALYVSNTILGGGQRHTMVDAYLGPEYTDREIQADLDAKNVEYVRHERDSLLEETSQEISKGNVVGWFQGRMEWGPRALGNRSILAHPGLPDMKDVLNARIKHRESFRPFAPTVIQERQSEIFEHTHPSPFMLHVYKIKPKWRERLLAVNHVDDTGRLQTLRREENPLYYDLIRKFEQQTGIPIILNTSFNENEPIVCLPSEAIDCFLRTKMDVLVIGSFVCKKRT